MNDDGITHETLAVFIENNRDFLLNVQAWISDRAEPRSLRSANFEEWICKRGGGFFLASPFAPPIKNVHAEMRKR